MEYRETSKLAQRTTPGRHLEVIRWWESGEYITSSVKGSQWKPDGGGEWRSLPTIDSNTWMQPSVVHIQENTPVAGFGWGGNDPAIGPGTLPKRRLLTLSIPYDEGSILDNLLNSENVVINIRNDDGDRAEEMKMIEVDEDDSGRIISAKLESTMATRIEL